jgi:hypothetical protein
MRFNRSLTRSLAATLAVVMLLTIVGPAGKAEAGLFSKITDTVKRHPVKSALVGVAAVGGAIIAAPYVATALGFGSGVAVAGGAGIGAAVAAAGTGVAAAGTAVVGGVAAAGGFLTGALGALIGGIGAIFSGIAGFIGGIIGSPLFIPALVVIGVAVAGYFLWKKYRRQTQTIPNGSGLPTNTPVRVPTNSTVEIPVNSSQTQNEIPQGGGNPVTTHEVPVNNSVEPTPAAPSVEVTPAIGQTSDALKAAHAEYIKAYNKYIGIVTNIGGSENPDEEMRTNMRRSDTQQALNEYRAAYNKYINLLRQSNAK